MIMSHGLVMTGCSRPLSYAVENAGNQQLNHVLVSTDSGHRFEHGVVIAKSHKSVTGGIPGKAENRFTISWTDASGKAHRAEISVSKKELQDERVRTLSITENMTLEKSWLLGKHSP